MEGQAGPLRCCQEFLSLELCSPFITQSKSLTGSLSSPLNSNSCWSFTTINTMSTNDITRSSSSLRWLHTCSKVRCRFTFSFLTQCVHLILIFKSGWLKARRWFDIYVNQQQCTKLTVINWMHEMTRHETGQMVACSIKMVKWIFNNIMHV